MIDRCNACNDDLHDIKFVMRGGAEVCFFCVNGIADAWTARHPDAPRLRFVEQHKRDGHWRVPYPTAKDLKSDDPDE